MTQEEWDKIQEENYKISAQRLADKIDQEVFEKILEEANEDRSRQVYR